MKPQELAWWRSRDLSGLTELERRVVVLRYDLEDAGQHTLEQIALATGYTNAHIFNVLKRARVRVDKEGLLAAGVAIQLVHDAPLDGMYIMTSGRRRSSDTLELLASYGIVTYNQLLDKSPAWLDHGGVGRATTHNIVRALHEKKLYLRGDVPKNPNRRISAPHTLTAD